MNLVLATLIIMAAGQPIAQITGKVEPKTCRHAPKLPHVENMQGQVITYRIECQTR